MNRDQDLTQAKHIGAGLSFIVFPAVRVFAFAVHPDLLHPQLLGPEELIRRAHGNDLLQFAHVLVMLNTALMVVIAVRFMRRLEHTRFTRAGLVGASLAVVGAYLLAADKGAMCLTMSALDTLPAGDFEQKMPGLIAIFSLKGWMVLVWGMALGPLGGLIRTVALWRPRSGPSPPSPPPPACWPPSACPKPSRAKPSLLANASASASAEAATTTLTARRDQTPDPGVVHEREPAANRTPEA